MLIRDHCEQLAHGQRAFAHPSKRAVDVDAIPIAAANPFRLDIRLALQLCQDLSHGALRDPNSLRDLKPGSVWATPNVHEHERVVGQKAPFCQPPEPLKVIVPKLS